MVSTVDEVGRDPDMSEWIWDPIRSNPTARHVTVEIPKRITDILDPEFVTKLEKYPATPVIVDVLLDLLTEVDTMSPREQRDRLEGKIKDGFQRLIDVIGRRDYFAFLEKIAPHTNFAITSYREDWYPRIWNPAMERITGCSHERVIEMYWQGRARLKNFPERWRYIVMEEFYIWEDLDDVHNFLGRQDKNSTGYHGAVFTLTTKPELGTWERKSLMWIRNPDQDDGGDSRLGDLCDSTQMTNTKKRIARNLEQRKTFPVRSANHLQEDIMELFREKGREYLSIFSFDEPILDDVEKRFMKYIVHSLLPEERFYRLSPGEFVFLRLGRHPDTHAILDRRRHAAWRQFDIRASGVTAQIDAHLLNISDEELGPEEIMARFYGIQRKMRWHIQTVRNYGLLEKKWSPGGNGIALPLHQKWELLGLKIFFDDTTIILTPEEAKLLRDTLP